MNQELTVLDRLIRELSANPEPAVLFGSILQGLDQALDGLDLAAIYILDPDSKKLNLVDSLRLDEKNGRRLMLLEIQAMGGDKGLEAENPFPLDPAVIGWSVAYPFQLTAIPIRSASMLIGFILIQTKDPLKSVSLTFAASVGHLLGLAIEQAGLISQLSRDLDRITSYRSALEGKNKELRRQVIRAEDASRLKSQFLANVSHEIRTPMNGILGMTELALGTNLNPRQRQFLQVVQSSAESLLILINDLLDISRIDAGKMEIESLPFDLRSSLEKVVDGLALKAEERGLDLNFRLVPETPSTLKGDPGRLRQVILNLVDNAIKFTDQGEVSLTIEPVGSQGERVRLRFSVIDTGAGIGEDDQKRIFQPFVQVDGTATRIQGGTGLGLAISQQLVEMMGGRLELESLPGKGSAFSFELDFQVDEEARPRAGSGFNLTGLEFLVVDDNSTNRLVLREMLSTWGAEVKEASSAGTALEILEEARSQGPPPALIILDGQLPDLDGFELAERLKKEKLARGSRILLLTSVGNPGDARRCREVGVSGYLIKPVKMAELRVAIDQVLGLEQGPPQAQKELVTRHSLAQQYQGVRILMAEDNLVNRMVIQEMLERVGWKVDIAATGQEVVELAETKVYDLILMDIQMPDMDGLTATKIIRKKRGSEDLPIIALTAHAMIGDRETCLRAGMNDYLSKPVKSAELVRAVARHLERKAADQKENLSGGPHAWRKARRKGPERRNAEAVSTGTLFGRRLGELPPVDISEARNLVDGDNALLKRVIQAFLNDTVGQVDSLKENLAKGLRRRTAEAAHRIKGAAGQLAAIETRALAARIEDLAEKEEMEAATELVEELDLALAKVKLYLEQFEF